MIRKYILTAILISSLVIISGCGSDKNPVSQPNVEDLGTVVTNNSSGDIFQIEISGDVDYYSKDMVTTSDNSYVILGLRNDEPYLIKISSSGEMDWEKVIDISTGTLKKLKIDFYGNLIIAGTSYINNSNDFYVLKFDLNGNILWSKNFDYGGNEYCNDMIVVPDGYVLCGYTTRQYHPDVQYIIKIDPDGELVWEKEYGSWREVRANCITRTSNNRLLVIGETTPNNAGRDVHVIKLFEDGEIINEKLIFNNAPNDFVPEIVVEDLIGNYIIAGMNDDYSSLYSNSVFNLVKINDQYEIVSDIKYFNIPILSPRDIAVNLGNSISIVGDGFPYYFYGVDGYLIANIGPTGDFISAYSNSRFRYMSSSAIIQTENGYAIAGHFIGLGTMVLIESSFDN